MPCKIISKKDRQHNGQKKRNNNDKQNIAQKTKDRATRTPLQTVGEVRCSGRVGSSCSTCGITSCWVYISQLQTLLYWLNLGYIHFQLQHLNHVIYWIHLLNSKCNSLIFHAYRENLKLNESLCNKLKQLFSIICFSHIWENQGTFSKSKLLFSVAKQLENR